MNKLYFVLVTMGKANMCNTRTTEYKSLNLCMHYKNTPLISIHLWLFSKFILHLFKIVRNHNNKYH